MLKALLAIIMVCAVMCVKAQSPVQVAGSNFEYHPASEDKRSWQRLNLWLSTIYLSCTKETSIDFDSALLATSRSLGLSRLPLIADGITDESFFVNTEWFEEEYPDEENRMLRNAKGKKRLQLTLLKGAHYSFALGGYLRYVPSTKKYFDEALAQSRALHEKELEQTTLFLMGKLYAQRNDTINALAVFNHLIDEGRTTGNKKLEAKAYAWLGFYTGTPLGSSPTISYSAAQTYKKIEYLSKARDIYHSLNDTENEIIVMTYIAHLYRSKSHIDEAYSTFLKALDLINSIGYPYSHYNTDAVVMMSMGQGKFGEPLKYALQTIKTAETARDSIATAVFYNRLASLYLTEGERDEEALKWLTKAADRCIADKDPNFYTVFYTMSGVMNKLGQSRKALDLLEKTANEQSTDQLNDLYYSMSFANCYLGLKDYKQAEFYAMRADSFQMSFDSFPLIGVYRRTLVDNLFGEIYFARGQYERSKQYFEKYLAEAPAMVSLEKQVSVYRNLIKIDSIFNDVASLAKHYRTYTELLDANFKASRIRQAEELQVVYQTQEKQSEINALNQRSKLERANLRQATLVRNLTILGIVGVLIIAILLYRQSRLRKKNNEVILQKNDQLQHLLTEKEWLLKEIHHRVKNNLQVVMSLLNTQSAYIDNDVALTAITESQHRVHAMSLIHQKLYNSDNLSSIDMSFYIRELAAYLRESFNTGQRIRFEFDIEPLKMDVSQAVPLGLILNEAITNSLKYAFPGDRDGMIFISLAKTSSERYLLRIADNGIGMPENHTDKKQGTLGMSLIAGLSLDLDGNFFIENNNGTVINVSFMYDEAINRHETLAGTFVSNN